MRALLRGLGYFWATPTSLVGAAFLLGLFLSGHELRVAVAPDGFAVAVLGPVQRWFVARRWAGVTFGFLMILWPLPTDEPGKSVVRAEILAHESAHVRQNFVLGPLFLPVYLVLLPCFGYRRHPLEVAARKAANQRG